MYRLCDVFSRASVRTEALIISVKVLIISIRWVL
jgi:hypothetical protein